MIFKLSLKNMKKSTHDYSIYFITLTVAVALSYIFNLLPYQPFMEALSKESSQDLALLLTQMTLPIIFIVAGLALYSNNFLLKRRSREIGIYLMLGTKYSHIHLMMIFETFFISIGSFIGGLGLGVGLSRIFDLLIIKLLGLKIDERSVLFSFPALTKTLISFALIFVIIAIFNYFVISRAKLIDIVRSNGESLRTKRFKINIAAQAIIFIFSVLSIAFFYNILLKINVDFTDIKTTLAMALGAVGHILLFVSGSGILAFIVSKRKRNLYKSINVFTLKQITNKISKNGIIISIISFIMAVTMVMLNMGISSQIWIDENLKYTSPYSISISSVQPNVPIDKVLEKIKQQGYTIDDKLIYNMYQSEYKLGDFLDEKKLDKIPNEYFYSLTSTTNIIKLSDYNKCRMMLGFKPIEIIEDDVALSISKDVLSAIEVKSNILILGNKLNLSINNTYTEPITDSRGVAGYGVTIIVHDDIITRAKEELPFTVSMAISTKEDRINSSYGAVQRELYDYVASYNGGHAVVVQSDVRDFNLKQASIMIFTGLFIGLILLMAGASILSLQQMTEITENKKGYDIIRKIGVSNHKVSKSILKQVGIYFIIPMIVAAVHSVFITIGFSKYSHFALDGGSFIFSILISFGVIIAMYLCYIIFTFIKCKKYVSE